MNLHALAFLAECLIVGLILSYGALKDPKTTFSKCCFWLGLAGGIAILVGGLLFQSHVWQL